MSGCVVPDTGWDVIYTDADGVELPDGDKVHTIYIEMKNKHNTMNSASSGKTYIKMQNQLLSDDDCACFLVEAIAKKSQNIKWEATVDGKKVHHRLIRRVSMDKFYAMVTGIDDAFYQVCMALPETIKNVVENSAQALVPHDTVMDELKSIAKIQSVATADLAVAMAVYMLGYGSYIGFKPTETEEALCK